MYPPQLLFFPVSMLLLSYVSSFPLLPPPPAPWSSPPLFSSAVSFPQLWADDYSNKQRLSLQITTLIQTPVLPLLLSVVVDYCAVLLRLSRAFVCLSQSHDDLVVTLRHALVGDTVAYPGKAKAQLFKSVLLCINSGWEEWLPATVMHGYLNSAIV